MTIEEGGNRGGLITHLTTTTMAWGSGVTNWEGTLGQGRMGYEQKEEGYPGDDEVEDDDDVVAVVVVVVVKVVGTISQEQQPPVQHLYGNRK